MANAPELVFDLIFGRWRSQTLYAGLRLVCSIIFLINQGLRRRWPK
jgi:hypothetical protein